MSPPQSLSCRVRQLPKDSLISRLRRLKDGSVKDIDGIYGESGRDLEGVPFTEMIIRRGYFHPIFSTALSRTHWTRGCLNGSRSRPRSHRRSLEDWMIPKAIPRRRGRHRRVFFEQVGRTSKSKTTSCRIGPINQCVCWSSAFPWAHRRSLGEFSNTLAWWRAALYQEVCGLDAAPEALAHLTHWVHLVICMIDGAYLLQRHRFSTTVLEKCGKLTLGLLNCSVRQIKASWHSARSKRRRWLCKRYRHGQPRQGDNLLLKP